jgi:hypothetical protein
LVLPLNLAKTIAGRIRTRIRGLRAPDSRSVLFILESQADRQGLKASPRWAAEIFGPGACIIRPSYAVAVRNVKVRKISEL